MIDVLEINEGVQVQLLSHEEANLMTSFMNQTNVWSMNHGEKASHIEIIYYPEDDGFEIASNEENNGLLRRNRVSTFRGELIAWATQQIQMLKGWDNSRKVTAFACIYRGNEAGVLCKTEAADTQVQATNEVAAEATE